MMNRIIATVHRADKTSIKSVNTNVATLGLTHRLVAFGTTGGKLADSTAPTAPAAMEVDGVLHLILAGKENPVDQLDHNKNSDYRTCKIEALLQGIVAENNNVQIKIHSIPIITNDRLSLQAISKNGFWFKIRADQGFKPEAYGGHVRLVCRGFETLIQRRDWARRLF